MKTACLLTSLCSPRTGRCPVLACFAPWSTDGAMPRACLFRPLVHGRGDAPCLPVSPLRGCLLPIAHDTTMPLTPNSAAFFSLASQAGVPRLELPDGRTIDRPHPEWLLHQLRWRWLLDSWEGGEAYRMAVYGFDLHGMPVRNLIRHKREYPSSFDAGYSSQVGRPAGTDQASQATDDDYELRRARTPVPTFVSEAVEAHLARIYSREVHRQGPDRLLEWWRNVDGRGTSIDQWISGTIAPLLLVLGQLDVFIDHPAARPARSSAPGPTRCASV